MLNGNRVILALIFFFSNCTFFDEIIFSLLKIKVIGLIQNMSHYVCPKCEHKAYIFGRDGARGVAKEMDLELLGKHNKLLITS